MGYKEKQIINNVLVEGSKNGRMFRINCGIAWAGKIVKRMRNVITLFNPRRFHGAPAGTPDCIGWESKTLCEIIKERDSGFPCQKDDMCHDCKMNTKIAIFKAVEVKTGKQTLSEEQKRFKKILEEHGGIYETRKD